MPDPILIREPRRDEWPAIERLVRAAWHKDYSAVGEVVLGIEALDDKVAWLRDEWNAFGSRFVVADDSGAVVGLAIAHVAEGWVWIDDLFVLPDERRHGIARALLAQSAPADMEVCAEVNARNAGAIALFTRLDFERDVETIVFRRGPRG
ncbi:MAG: GNAT family N-acetyltransferase [Marmoricola sp.]